MLKGFPFDKTHCKANGPHEVRLYSSAVTPCALLGTWALLRAPGWAGEKSGLFEHPAGVCSCCAIWGTIEFCCSK